MKLLAALFMVTLAATVCSDLSEAREVKKSEYRRYMRFARMLALKTSREHAKIVTEITGVTRDGNLATIRYNALETKCKPGSRPPVRRRCPPLPEAVLMDCIGKVKFLGGGFRRPKYLNETLCM
ncbi:hypothetical protein HPB52_017360 [Rhipicephalus sanguineus]|uniref:Uncharacterized protein n=1 Tax=Rhipicephalus sanguineus TaxID=34632 RepID=A0A9D4QB56_RHISA|nr:hypothetical protein HPB52_017360 [Rhipicephalus sanguineus]